MAAHVPENSGRGYRFVRRLTAQLVLLVVLGAIHAPNLATALTPVKFGCCGQASGCGCTRNGRKCYCKHTRPSGWWGEEQKCPGRGIALVTATAARVQDSEVSSFLLAVEPHKVGETKTQYFRRSAARPQLRGPPTFSS